MVKILRDGNTAFKANLKTLEEVRYIFLSIKEKDKEYGNFSYKIEGLNELIQNQFLQLEKQRLNKILDTYGYNGLSDIQFYASQNDEEAKALLEWYKNYDDGIWNWIDNDLQAITALEELLDLDLRHIEEQIFKNSIKTNPLP